jgi:hypothetical protein
VLLILLYNSVNAYSLQDFKEWLSVQNGENPGNEFDVDTSGPKYPRTARDLGAVAFQVSHSTAPV